MTHSPEQPRNFADPSPEVTPAQPARDWTQGISRQRLKPGLYIVATPIGNLRDITLRALDVLQAADRIYCEDTRVTKRLLSAYGIAKTPIRCDEHTETQRSAEIIDAISQGGIIAFVSDAGTPGISDPGARLAAAIAGAQMTVSPIPGPSAVTAALSAAGLTQTGQFLFLGFLPPKSGARRKVLQTHLELDAALVFYEAPQRVADLLTDIQAIMGERQVVIARELTKLHEQFYRGTPENLSHAIAHENFKGEVAVILLPADQQGGGWTDTGIDNALTSLLADVSLKEAVARVAAQSGLPRKTVYARALALDRRDA